MGWIACAIAFAAILLTGCDQRLPKEPGALVAEVERRMETAPTSKIRAGWLVHVADVPTTAARDLLLDSLRAPHPILSGSASEYLGRLWVRDPGTREKIRRYYLDPAYSYRNRQTLFALLISKYNDTYPDFADLPSDPPRIQPVWIQPVTAEAP